MAGSTRKGKSQNLPEPPLRPLWWDGKVLCLLDQSLLPGQEKILRLDRASQVYQAIRSLKVRGAPAIGVAAAYGVVLAAKKYLHSPPGRLRTEVARTIARLRQARPTAYNLFYALDRMEKVLACVKGTSEELVAALLCEARTFHQEDLRSGWSIGEYGWRLVKPNSNLLTHCNAGALATSGFGTALSLCYAAVRHGVNFHVYVDETRPVLQGARLTAYELKKAGIPCTLICDSMAAFLMAQGKVDLVVVGADRIAGNGDTANKIGTYQLALAAHRHHLPFYVAAPLSTFHPELPDGQAIPVEERAAEEVTTIHGYRLAPEGTKVYNPAFDITPARFIAGFITEKGIIRPPYRRSLKTLLRE